MRPLSQSKSTQVNLNAAHKALLDSMFENKSNIVLQERQSKRQEVHVADIAVAVAVAE